jgi:hypothetical protein
MQDTAYLFRLLNSACASMFSMFRELKLPDEILDGIINHDPKALENAIAYLKEDQVCPLYTSDAADETVYV